MDLKEFMLYLGRHPFRVVEAKKDPYKVMKEAGLSEELQALLMSGDVNRIAAEVSKLLKGSNEGSKKEAT